MGALDRRDAEFTSFVEEHGAALLRAAHFLTGDRWQAEDLVQLALTKTYLAWPAARGRVPYAYARKALLSCHTDLWRRRRWREDSTAPEDLPDGRAVFASLGGAPSGADLAQAAADRDAVDHALVRLTPRERAVVVLRYCEDLSERETAHLLRVGVGTIKSLNARALAKMRAEPSPGEPGAEPLTADLGDAKPRSAAEITSAATPVFRRDDVNVDHRVDH